MRLLTSQVVVLSGEEVLGYGACLHLGFAPRALDATPACADGSFTAFVVGAQAYPSPCNLSKCVADAEDMAWLLHRKGYTVTRLLDLSTSMFRHVFQRFVDVSVRAGSTALLYFSGHGLQVGGANYMVPVDALELGTPLLGACIVCGAIVLPSCFFTGSAGCTCEMMWQATRDIARTTSFKGLT
jgi:hypothetical protein